MLLTWIDDYSLQKTQTYWWKAVWIYRMLICGVHKQQRWQWTKHWQLTIQEYLSGSSVQKSTCSPQLGSSLQLGLMRYFHENAFCVHSRWICFEWGRCCVATCALYHIVWFFPLNWLRSYHKFVYSVVLLPMLWLLGWQLIGLVIVYKYFDFQLTTIIWLCGWQVYCK